MHIGGLFAIGTSFGIDGSIITSDLNFLRVFPRRDRGLIDMGLIRLKPGTDAVAVRDGLRKILPADVEVLTKEDLLAREVSYWATTTPIGFVFNFGVVIGVVVGAPFVHVSLDMDAVDPAYAPGVGTPVRGGLSYREAHLAMELIAEAGLANSLEVVEVNPILDRENETAALAVELVASALGATIL